MDASAPAASHISIAICGMRVYKSRYALCKLPKRRLPYPQGGRHP